MYPYQVSVIMAVYNVAPFLHEAVDSVIAQNIGFSNIQLILVDDGSTDESGAICDEYAAQHPENILVLHKENGGVSSARNAGIPLAQGKYLNFMDADDTLSENVCAKVIEFFEKRYNDVDVVAFPMYFFDARTGAHILNNKFSKGSRVIDLRKEYDLIQLSTASAFLKHETVARLNLRYDERLCFTEDAKLLAALLSEKMRLGVVSTCRYRVRRRLGAAPSATQQSGARREWWLDTLKYFQRDTITFCMARFGYLPRYVQYLLCYDLQWRLQQSALPHGLLSEEEIREFSELLPQIFTHIDDEIIRKQKHIWREHKAYALRLKYGKAPELHSTSENIQLYYREHEVFSLADHSLNLAFLTQSKTDCKIEGFLMLCTDALEDLQIEAHTSDGRIFPCTPAQAPKPTQILGEAAQTGFGFSVSIPLPESTAPLALTFHVRCGASCVRISQLRMGKFFPLTHRNAASHLSQDGYLTTCRKNELIIQKAGLIRRIKSELSLLRELWRKNQVGGRKAVAARCVYNVLRFFKRKPLILISDRITRGGDNGEAMFRYLASQHKHDVTPVFVVSKESPDFKSLRRIGHVVDAQSHLHKLLHLLCDYNLSSSAEIHTVDPFAGYESHYADILNHVKFVFLQHGITKDDISGWINRYDKNMYGIVAAANAEHDAFLGSGYCYAPENIWLTGFPRFDRLYRDEKKRIAIVPTWRKQLMGTLDPQTGLWSVAPDFAQSAFLQFYKSLLNDARLHDALRRTGYTLQFFPHPNLLGVLDQFEAPATVELLDASTQYRDLYAHADLILTDYSSAVFDFAYLRKCVLYCQFDADTFFSGAHSYEKGYFDYERDGFGEVEYTLEGTVDRLIEYIENGCTLKDEYRARIDRFFAFSDGENCRRVYEKLFSNP